MKGRTRAGGRKEASGIRGKIEETCRWLRGRGDADAECGIILGTGLGRMAARVRGAFSVAYDGIPHFPVSTAPGHEGRLLFGSLEGKRVCVLEGRFHFYEGHSLDAITFPVRVMKGLGVRVLILSNAAGGMNPEYRKGDLVAITDHINFMGVNPLIGPNDAKLGIRFPDMIEPYSRRLLGVAEKVARENKLPFHKGVYMGVTGPNLETRAEYRFMRLAGADLVGMSTVPEVIVGVHAGLEILALSIVTDLCLPDALHPVDIAEIIRVANEAGPKLETLLQGVIRDL